MAGDAGGTYMLRMLRALQHLDRDEAERRAQEWMNETFGIAADAVCLRPHRSALDSLSGVVTVHGEDFYFSSQIESGNPIKEHYNSRVLQIAGYNTLLPMNVFRRPEQQIALYPIVDHPMMFDLARWSERGEPTTFDRDRLLTIEARESARMLDVYLGSAAWSSDTEHACAPIHQLFWHRLTGRRFSNFYGVRTVRTPGGREVDIGHVFDAKWIINGVTQKRKLRDLVTEAVNVLNPARDALTVIGHGDAHLGNLLLDTDEHYLYIDAAFAGRHSVLLDVARPLFFDVFAQWIYFPNERIRALSVDVDCAGTTIAVNYGNAFSALRRAYWETKRKVLIDPVVEWLRDEGLSAQDARPLELALMCCPLLARNLTDRIVFPPKLTWLGLALAVQLGNGDDEQEFAFAE
ncbi:hypothetical protein F3087_40230 [Nocardia colli]|uniref:Phosphotransferase n=1 Tax=Nocardia colli TaxID=2545717 RepID=A0A5N0DXN6_9NOCA|nr:hypothetical protein [Nocardia colli]KAA8881897.1 hypothetical protein F3087_40230 [Nocardia colli]